MSNALDIMQVATSGAAVFVAEMAKSGWEAVRSAIASFFRQGQGGEEAAAEELRLLDAARVRLVECPDDEREAVAEALRRELFIQLAAFLQKNPETAVDLQELVDGAEPTEGGAGSRNSVHHNTNSQVVISGGSIRAGGGIVYRAPGNGK
ncbi:hypothetical protein [Streptomyces sp. NPDC088757]|uniref:hypothetical protein n=1 Tax=Streptomyces sp. NPDC088757 TaxID=3365889 RepID=UPI00381962D7